MRDSERNPMSTTTSEKIATLRQTLAERAAQQRAQQAQAQDVARNEREANYWRCLLRDILDQEQPGDLDILMKSGRSANDIEADSTALRNLFACEERLKTMDEVRSKYEAAVQRETNTRTYAASMIKDAVDARYQAQHAYGMCQDAVNRRNEAFFACASRLNQPYLDGTLGPILKEFGIEAPTP
jgi:hypothetical protein